MKSSAESGSPHSQSERRRHALSIDVECYYQIFTRNFFGEQIRPTREVVECTERILDLLKQTNSNATFFVVGNVAREFPELVQRIVDEGHELGSHGDAHLYVNRISRSEFQDDLRRSKETLEEIGRCMVSGFRAPQFSIDCSTPWAYDVLVEEGFVYDSSIFPFRGRRYGDPKAPLKPWRIQTERGELLEVPMTVVELWKRRFPTAGGGYLRYFPYWMTSSAIRRVEHSNRSAVIYLHPYELAAMPDEADFQKSLAGAGGKTKLIHRMQLLNRKKTFDKLSRMLNEFDLGAIREVFGISDASRSRIASDVGLMAGSTFHGAN